MKIDKEFSDYSLEYGIAKSFLKYCDDSAVLVHDNSMPVIGINELAKIYDTTKSSTHLLSWEPLNGMIAKSGDLGYTYGTWKYMNNDSNKTVLAEGCYVTVWKKDHAGNWKWVLDTGTDGLSKKKED
jgi:ketosteroid isomerase-like protein